MGIAEIIVGVFAVIIGALFCFSGNVLMRVLFPFIGFFVGFSAGAGLVTAITGDGLLSTLFSWVVGLVLALVFALLSYFFYAFAVVLAFAGVGFTITSGLLAFLNLDWNWLVILLGTLVGVVFAVVAIVARLPIVFLAVASAMFGSAVVIYGLMLMFNTAELGDFSNGQVRQIIADHIGLYIVWLMLGVGGSISQSKQLGKEQKAIEEYWEKSPTFQQYLAKNSK